MGKQACRFILSRFTTFVVVTTILIVLLLDQLSAAVSQRVQRPLDLSRIKGPIRLDGVTNEAAWQAIKPLPLTMYVPENGSSPSEKSEIRVAYDDQYLYASGRFSDSNPSGIRANTLSRDSWNGDDTFEITLDTFRDNQNAVHFYTNPLGMRADEAVSNDAIGDNVFNSSWNTFWDVAAKRDSAGWSVEVRIPFSSLRFRSKNETVTMGLTVFRYIARKNETDIFPPRAAKWERAVFKPSLSQTVFFRNIKSRSPIYIAPYALGQMSQNARMDSSGDSFRTVSGRDQEYGADMKYSISSDLTLDLTTNTDFAQVESDDQQINLTPFAIFLPEKRLFFQERASLFDFATGRDGRLFYSRRIGLADNGKPLRIYGGGRLIGKIGNWDLGVMNMQTAAIDGSPGENLGVFRTRHALLNDSSYTGAMLTTRMDLKGNANINYGVDNNWKFFDADSFVLNLAQTIDLKNYANSIKPSLSSAMLRAQWERSVLVGWSYRGGFTYSGRNFQPELGFIEREDFRLIDTRLAYGWEPSNSRVRYHQAIIRPLIFLRNSDGSLETVDVAMALDTNRKSGYFFSLGPHLQYESLRTAFDLSADAHVPAGEYTFPGFGFYLNTPGGGKGGTEFDSYYGKYYDGTRLTLRFIPRWYVSRHLSLTGEYDINRIHFDSRQRVFLDNFYYFISIPLSVPTSV